MMSRNPRLAAAILLSAFGSVGLLGKEYGGETLPTPRPEPVPRAPREHAPVPPARRELPPAPPRSEADQARLEAAEAKRRRRAARRGGEP